MSSLLISKSPTRCRNRSLTTSLGKSRLMCLSWHTSKKRISSHNTASSLVSSRPLYFKQSQGIQDRRQSLDNRSNKSSLNISKLRQKSISNPRTSSKRMTSLGPRMQLCMDSEHTPPATNP